MLRRLIQRPSTRSIAAAAWPLIPTAQLHGSSRRLQSPNSGLSPSQPEPDDNKTDDAQAVPKKTPSLFEQLFPDEAKQTRAQQLDGLPKSAWASQAFDEPPPLAAPIPDEHPAEENDNDAYHHNYGPRRPGTRNPSDASSSSSPSSADNPLRAQSMLILSAASKQLLESDFMRLGRRGAHVEGWVAGIQRVVQARDPDTLQPLGHYFVLFDSDAAAAAYRHEVERLWQLAKAQASTAAGPYHHHHHRRRGRRGNKDAAAATAATAATTSRDGPDVAAAVKSFTLVPPSQRYYLRQAGGGRERLDRFDLGGASFVDRLAARAGSEHLVLLTVDGGRVSVDALRRAIEDDGADRHLPWRVAWADRESGGGSGGGSSGSGSGSGILPFGKSVLKKHDTVMDGNSNGKGNSNGSRDIERSLLDQVDRVMGTTDGGGNGGEQAAAAAENGEDTHTDPTASAAGDKQYRQYPRFIVPFLDAAEAHRFVRSWHRRQLKLQMNLNQDKEVSWDEIRTLNASVLW
ncbi:hypothetical protein Hte_000689 [Hypoxylon texense]